MVAGIVVLLLGFGLDLINLTPIIKRISTTSFVLASAGWVLLLMAFLYWLIDKKKIQNWTTFFKPAGSNPLLTYIIPDIIFYFTALLGIALLPYSLRYGWPGILLSAFYAVAIMGLVILLNRMKLKLQL